MSRLYCILAFLAAVCSVGAVAGERKKAKPIPKAKIEDAKRVRVPIFDAETGKRLALLEAVTVTPDPKNSQNLRATDVRILTFQETKTGRKTNIINGKTGTFDMAAKKIHLEGDVVMIFDDAEKMQDRTHVYVDDLLWEGKSGTATTDGAVRIERPDMTITGVGMTVYRGAKPEPSSRARRARAGGAAKEKRVQQGKVIIHRHNKTIIHPDKGEWLVPAPRGKKGSAASGAKPSAPLPEAKPQKPTPPIVITCKGPLTIDRTVGTATYENDVRAVQGKQSITCERLVLGFQPGKAADGKPVLHTVNAFGRVRIDDGTIFGLGDHAVLHRLTNVLTLTGRPAELRWDNGNRIAAGSIQRMQNGEVTYCTSTEEHRGNVFLLLHSAGGQAGKAGKKDEAPEARAPAAPAAETVAPPGPAVARP